MAKNNVVTATAPAPAGSTPKAVTEKRCGGGVKGRSGPAKFNLNAARSGGNISRLTLGELPNTMKRQLQNARKYRRYVEQLVLDAHGEVDATAAHLIDEATCAEVHSAICRWLMRTRLETMTPAEIARCSEQILKSKTIRNRAIERLRLNAPPMDPWNVIDSQPASGNGEQND